MIGTKVKPKNPLTQVPSVQQYSVRLYEGTLEEFSRVLFTSQSVKAAYVAAEYKSLFKYYLEYWGAGTLEKRSSAFALLCAKRVLFAKSRGYSPKKTNKKEWVLSPTQNTPKTIA